MRHSALEPSVLGAIDLAHPARSEGIENLVVGEGLAGSEGHAVKSLVLCGAS
jgi:hypothetical protein